MKLIDKDALVAEIERLKADALQKKSQCKRSGLERIMHQIGAYNKILSFLDTLEVKEVDIEKKKMEWIEQLCKYFKANYLYVSGHESFISDFRMYAKNLK